MVARIPVGPVIVQVRDRVAEWIASEVPAIERLSPRLRLRQNGPENILDALAARRAVGASRPVAQVADRPESAGMEDHREADTSRSPARSLRKERRARRRLLERKLRAK